MYHGELPIDAMIMSLPMKKNYFRNTYKLLRNLKNIKENDFLTLSKEIFF